MLIVIVDPMHIGSRLTLITEKVAMNMGIEENLTLQPLKFMYFLGIRVTWILGVNRGSAGSQELVVLQAMTDADGVGSQKTDN